MTYRKTSGTPHAWIGDAPTRTGTGRVGLAPWARSCGSSVGGRSVRPLDTSCSPPHTGTLAAPDSRRPDHWAALRACT
jgi:hypothetical protein